MHVYVASQHKNKYIWTTIRLHTVSHRPKWLVDATELRSLTRPTMQAIFTENQAMTSVTLQWMWEWNAHSGLFDDFKTGLSRYCKRNRVLSSDNTFLHLVLLSGWPADMMTQIILALQNSKPLVGVHNYCIRVPSRSHMTWFVCCYLIEKGCTQISNRKCDCDCNDILALAIKLQTSQNNWYPLETRCSQLNKSDD